MGSVSQGTGVPGSFGDALNGSVGSALKAGTTISTLTSAIAVAAITAGVQVLAFYILRLRLKRIYRPKTYMVAERLRTPEPPPGLWQWIIPIFNMPNSVIINKCGLDAYFFLRYLRMLLKIFFPMAAVILPILIPINRLSGPPTVSVTGPASLGWQNIGPQHITRIWAHLVLAVVVVIWVCYVLYTELRGYIRIRQAYLTSPQHRIRASATTVLVSGIPRKWLSVEALNGLYDVFPGGIRNIWINRDYGVLLDKVKLRDKTAKNLESAETALIQKCVKSHRKKEEKKSKEQGVHMSKEERHDLEARQNADAQQYASGQGTSSGNPHQMAQNIHDAAGDIGDDKESGADGEKDSGSRATAPLRFVGKGVGAFGTGLSTIGRKGKHAVGGVTSEVGTGLSKTNNVLKTANEKGFDAEPEQQEEPLQQLYTRADAMLEQLQRSATNKSVHRSNDDPTTVRAIPAAEEAADASAPVQDQNQPETIRRVASSHHTSQHPTGLRTRHPETEEEKAKGVFKEDGDEQDRSGGRLARTLTKVKTWKQEPPMRFPSPEPKDKMGEEYQLNDLGAGRNSPTNMEEPQVKNDLAFWKKSQGVPEPTYPVFFNDGYDRDQDGEAEWMKYIEYKDRDTIRLPVAGWMPALPLMGKKVDKIYHLRRELARLNSEIEYDQANADKFALMNSAFIQFNHQIAAHMACQSVSHHVPQHMAPRSVEISPKDVIWSNMSIQWWSRWLRTAGTVAIIVGLIILFAIPVSFTGALSQIDTLAARWHWLDWLTKLPKFVIGIIQGALPAVLLSLLLILVPVILGVLVKLRGVPTGTEKQLGIQQVYFMFLFIQVFLVVSLSSGLTSLLPTIASDPEGVVTLVAKDLPNASNYFFSYMIVQSLGNSAGSLLQIFTLLMWFVIGPMLDNTPRKKWHRQTTLSNISWGSYFPPFTNFAVIGLIFSIIDPLIMVFNLITFSLFWFVQRYNVIYVNQNTEDTGGLLFPQAVDQLFAGLYVMEICLIGLFFIARNTAGNVAAIPQAIIMIVVLVFTVAYHVLLNYSIKPLLRYLPITLEDDAVIRDQEFARAQESKWRGLTQEETDDSQEHIEARLEAKEREEEAQERAARQAEKRQSKDHDDAQSRSKSRHNAISVQTKPNGDSWKQKAWNSASAAANLPSSTIRRVTQPRGRTSEPTTTTATDFAATGHGDSLDSDDVTISWEQAHGQEQQKDVESQRLAGDVLFSGFSDELEDLTPEERDTLVRYSFQHEALRARRPVVWIPRDPLGISDDEIARSKLMSTVVLGEEETEEDEPTRTYIWMSNEGTALDAKGRVVFRKSPPDFASVDLIQL